MKIRVLTKNAVYMFGYGCSIHRFKKVVRSSPDNNIKRIPARKLAKLIKEVQALYRRPLFIDDRKRCYY